VLQPYYRREKKKSLEYIWQNQSIMIQIYPYPDKEKVVKLEITTNKEDHLHNN